MDNVWQKIAFIEIVERLARLKRFVRLDRSQSKDVVRVFDWAIRGVLKSIEPLASDLSNPGEQTGLAKEACDKKLSNAFMYFSDFHEKLSQIRGGWVLPETHVFINKILDFIPTERKPDHVSVVLLDEYSFEADDLASFARSLLLKEGVKLNTVDDRPTVSLPKTERDNLLNWADLVHEIGHVDRDGIDELLGISDLIPSASPDRIVLEAWAEELYCDLFAVSILGPAYASSFAAFCLINSGVEPKETGSSTHPPDILRMCLMSRMLERKGLTIPLRGLFSAYGDSSQLFYQAFEERGRVGRLCRNSTTDENQGILSEGGSLTDFMECIMENIDGALEHQRILDAGDFSGTPNLANRLADGVLIGSYPNKNEIEQYVRDLPLDLTTLDAPSRYALFNKAKHAIRETHSSPWEIVNAGWLHKVESIYPWAFELFFDGDMNLEDKLESFDNRLAATDQVLLKSIEVAHIHELLAKE